MLKTDEIKTLIDKNAVQHKSASDDDSWLYESLEIEVLHAIFDYCDFIGLKIEGYDIRRILDAEDDEDEGVPPEGSYQALLNLQIRMTESDIPNPIQIPNEVKELFEYYEKSFWPDLYELRKNSHD